MEPIVNKHEENIEGHDCMFEIYGETHQYKGKAEIKDPCISTKRFTTSRDSTFTTERSVKEYLKAEIKKYLKNPTYSHPIVGSNEQPIGTRCIVCNHIIKSNDGFRDVKINLDT